MYFSTADACSWLDCNSDNNSILIYHLFKGINLFIFVILISAEQLLEV